MSADGGLRTHLQRHMSEIVSDEHMRAVLATIRETARCPLCPADDITKEELMAWAERTRGS